MILILVRVRVRVRVRVWSATPHWSRSMILVRKP